MDLVAGLEATLSEPTDTVRAAAVRIAGDVAVLGASGKMGPTLVRQLIRADREAGVMRTVFAVARFGDQGQAQALAAEGARVIQADLLDPDVVRRLPDVPNVISMVGQKFGTVADPSRTWAINAAVPALVAHRYRAARIVVFSTGNVYPLWPTDSAGPTEADPVAPIGDYAQSAMAREMVFRHYAERYGTPLAILRINYAIEPRYGVIRDLADKMTAGIPIDLTMGYVNLIWQRDANAIAIAALTHCASPPLLLNVTGSPAIAVRSLAEGLGTRLGVLPAFQGAPAVTALLSNPARAYQLFGSPPMSIDGMLDRVAAWVRAGGPSLGKPTHFEQRAGVF